MMPLAVTFDYQPWEQFRVQRLLMRTWSWYLAYALAAGLPLLILVLAFVGSRLSPDGQGLTFSEYWYLLVPPALVLFFLPLTQFYGAVRHVRSHHLPHREHTVNLTDAGIEVSCVAAKVAIPWRALYRVTETPRFFLFYIRKNSAYYIPKRAIAPAVETAIRDCLRAHAPKATVGEAAA